MPGETDLLDEFCASLEPTVLGQVVREVFERMRIAGDAGSLLRIETDIAEIVEEAKSQWLAEEAPTDRQGNPLLFAKSSQRTIFEMERVTADFWSYAEQRVFDALRRFAVAVENDAGFRRKLFADDAERGFAFIDLCRKRFDVMLMNPPFGDAALPSKDYIDSSYGDTKGDVYKAFVEGSFDRLVPAGMLGIISSRNAFFANQSADWRNRVVRRLFRPVALADLGDGVLDAAVSTAGYVLRRVDLKEEAALTLDLLPALRSVPLDRAGTFSTPQYQRHRGNLKRHQAVQELSWLVGGEYIRTVVGRTKRFGTVSDLVPAHPIPAQKSDPLLICVCLLLKDDKAGELLAAIQQVQSGQRHYLVYLVRPSSFDLVPTSPFAYWVSNRVRGLFKSCARLEGDARTVKQGLATADDFRFVRCWWEVESDRLMDGSATWSTDRFLARTSEGKRWVWFGKGGSLKPFCADLHLVVNYADNGHEIKAWATHLEEGAHWSKRIYSTDYYFRPGLTFGTRLRRFGVVPFPQGSIFGHMSPLITSSSGLGDSYTRLSAYLSSNIVRALLGLMTPPRKNEVGYVANIPIPWQPDEQTTFELESLGLRYGALSLANACVDETHARFAFSTVAGDPEVQATASCFDNGGEVDQVVAKALGLGDEDRADLLGSLAWVSGLKADSESDGGEEDEDSQKQNDQLAKADSRRDLSLAIGCVFGRWDIRHWMEGRFKIGPVDPYEPLPSCPPASLSGPNGLPARPGDVNVGDYPVNIEWSGILVDEPHHPADICSRAVECLSVRHQLDNRAIEDAICSELGLDNIREYFRNPRGWLQHHLDSYFKSRRHAPIYWQLSLPSRRYSVWLYYQRINQDTFWKVLSDFVRPKLLQEERRLAGLRAEAGENPTASLRRVLQDQESLVGELAAFRDDMEAVAPLWHPTLDDGVMLNHAILWRLTPQLPPWQHELREVWQGLCLGKFDWSHIAMHLWPDRVVRKCAGDRSLAIAHGLEDEFWEEQSDGKWTAKKRTPAEVGVLVEQRSSKVVTVALETLLSRTPGAGTGTRGKGSSRRKP